MPICKNPECGKEIPEGRVYCDQTCLERHIELKRHKKNGRNVNDPNIEAILKHMGIEKSNFGKRVAYQHWHRFVEFLKNNSGKKWNDFLRPRLRSYIGIDFRYIDDYLESCISWEIVALENDTLVFIGIPKEEPINAHES